MHATSSIVLQDSLVLAGLTNPRDAPAAPLLYPQTGAIELRAQCVSLTRGDSRVHARHQQGPISLVVFKLPVPSLIDCTINGCGRRSGHARVDTSWANTTADVRGRRMPESTCIGGVSVEVGKRKGGILRGAAPRTRFDNLLASFLNNDITIQMSLIIMVL